MNSMIQTPIVLAEKLEEGGVMRVLRNNDVVEVTCKSCGSLLAVGIEDVMVDDVGHHGTGQSVSCCRCGATIWIAGKDIPAHWRSRLFKDFE